MKRVRINLYDLLTLLLAFLLILTVILHIVIPRRESERETAKIEIKLEKIKFKDSLPEHVSADGRFSFEVKGVKDGTLYISCPCFKHSAGIMSIGGKLLCPNQPISLSARDFYAEGRISRIDTLPVA